MENENDEGQCSAEIVCPIVIEHLDANGISVRKASYKTSSLSLARNEFKDIVLRVECGNVNMKYNIQELNVHKRFLRDGKATIHLPSHRVRIFVSNCAPNQLLVFIKTLCYKMQATQKNQGIRDYRKRLLSDKPQKLTDISPLMPQNVNVVNGQRSTKPIGPETTPTLKRKREERRTIEMPSDKKVNRLEQQSSSMTMNTLFNLDLTEEQKSVLNAVQSGKNLFFTGSAGTGKSYLLKKIVRMLPPESTFVTASTGVAAMQIGGTTLHSFAGVGSGIASLEQCLEKLTGKGANPNIVLQWRKCRHLVVDEISMVQGEYFAKLEKLARLIRKNDRPFGGIQLVLCGDFLQLPPVTKDGEKKVFCFQTNAWKRCVQLNIELTKIHRQNDKNLIDILRYIRFGRCTDEISAKLAATFDNKLERDGILATNLCTHNVDVNLINEDRLQQLQGKSVEFVARDSDPSLSSMIDKHCQVESKILLKIGTQVMLLKNLDIQRGLVNGSRGVLIRFEGGAEALPVVKFACGLTTTIKYERWTVRVAKDHFIRRQLPLKLAWAISIHKAQGMTLDCVEMSLGKVFESGQAYVALSRARNLEGLRVIDFNKNCIRANPDVVDFYKEIRNTKNAIRFC